MTQTLEKPLTVAEYLEFERKSETRHEYVDGELIAMAGEKRKNNRIALNFVVLLQKVADNKLCEVVSQSVRIRTRATRYRYPDFAVSCAPGDDPYFLENPCLIVEVLSVSTEHTDFGKKLDEYTQLPSLERYVLVSSDERFVVVYKRMGEQWVVKSLEQNGEFDVPCLGSTLTLEQIYDGVVFQT
jgi:Uma2 family endonuclease